jgi:2-aminoadipate transaminase
MAERERDREGVTPDPARIILTNGSMQGITLVAETLCEGRGDVVVMEEFNYSGTIAAFNALGIEMVGVPLDGHGMRIDALEDVLGRLRDQGRAPRFIYTLATYQNPTGTVMPRERRLELLEVARQHACIVFEDNCYADVHFDGDKPPALYALDDGPGQIYACSLSKILAPGVRLGYLIARDPIFERLIARRQDAGPNTLAAAIATEYLRDRLWEHVEMANAALRRKRNAMLDALDEHMGNLASWSRPAGGLFIWLRLPEDVDLAALESLGAERELSFAQGAKFHVRGDAGPHILFAFGFPRVEDVRDGIAVLARCVRELRRG